VAVDRHGGTPMSEGWVRDLITSGKAVIGTAISSAGQQLIQYICQSSQQRDQARREQLAAWCAAVDRDDFNSTQFAHSNTYATLRGHLPEELQQEIDSWRNPRKVEVVVGEGRHPIQSRLLKEIARVEREWGLI
jgi:hypothetical protein